MEKKIATAGIIYFVIGIFFAFIYALFYHWPLLSLFSPGFYMVVVTWPIQVLGFVMDFQVYGLTGKVLY
jgi:hypothetical protein